MNKYVIDTQALVKFLKGKKVINDKIDLILRKADQGEHHYYYTICGHF